MQKVRTGHRQHLEAAAAASVSPSARDADRQGHPALQGRLRQDPSHQGHGERAAPALSAARASQFWLLTLGLPPQRVYAEAKTIMFDGDSRRKLQIGINKVADAVGVTLGPRGESRHGRPALAGRGSAGSPARRFR